MSRVTTIRRIVSEIVVVVVVIVVVVFVVVVVQFLYCVCNHEKVVCCSQSLFTLNLIEDYLSRTVVPHTEDTWIRNRNYFSECTFNTLHTTMIIPFTCFCDGLCQYS